MNKYIYVIILMASMCCGLAGCVEDPELAGGVKNATVPTVRLLTGVEEGYDLSKTATTITLQAEVESANGLPVDSYGFCWSLDENPTVENGDTIVCGTGLGIYEGTAENLEADTTYHIRPYAINGKGVAYGDGLTVTTNTGIGTIKTLDPWDVKANSAICGGLMMEQGEGELVKQGVYLYESSLEDSSPQFVPIEIEAERDSFFQVVTGLKPSTTYYVMAYVENAFGIFPGGEAIRFTTTDGKPYISSFSLMGKDYTSATFRAVLSTSGDSEITDCGYCYSTTNQTPSLEDDDVMKVSCRLTNDSVFIGTLADLEQQTVYYVRAYVENSFGLTYNEGSAYELLAQSQAPTVTTSEITTDDMYAGSVAVEGRILDKGESDVVEAGFCWSTLNEPTIEGNKISVYQGDSIFTGTISGLRGATTYYIRAYATNSNTTSYGETREIVTPDIVTELASYSGEPVTEASSCISGSIGYVFGGDLGSERSNTLMAYSFYNNAWTQRNPAEVAVKGAAFVPLNQLYIFCLGGKDNQNEVTNSFYYYSNLRNEWTLLENEQVALSDASGVSVNNNNTVYFVGGSERNDAVSDKVYRYNWNDTLKEVGRIPEPQFGCVAVMIGGTIYAGLGRTGSGASGFLYSKRLWASDAGANDWNELTACPTEANGIIRGVACGNELFVLDTNLEIWMYDPETDEWTKRNTSLRSELGGGEINNVFMFAYQNSIYIGITNGSGRFVKYDPSWDN